MPSAINEPEFSLFTSMRYDPKLIGYAPNNKYSANTEHGSALYMFRLHRDRMLLAAKHFKWHAAVAKLTDLSKLESLVLGKVAEWEATHESGKPLKLRLVVTSTGEFSTTCSPSLPTSLMSLYPTSLSPTYATDSDNFTIPNAPWPVALDPHRTPATAYTRWKTTLREMYDSARARVGIESPAAAAEVLLQNEHGELTEGSYTSCFFFRNGRWVTPPVSSGGQQGTTRRWALENGVCVEEAVPAASLTEGEGVWVSNGVKGCIWGRIHLSPAPLVPAAAKATLSTTTTHSSAASTVSTNPTSTTDEAAALRKVSGESAARASSEYGNSTRDWLSAVNSHSNQQTSGNRMQPFHEVKSVWKDWILS